MSMATRPLSPTGWEGLENGTENIRSMLIEYSTEDEPMINSRKENSFQ